MNVPRFRKPMEGSRYWIMEQNGISIHHTKEHRVFTKGDIVMTCVNASLESVEEVFGTLLHREKWNPPIKNPQ